MSTDVKPRVRVPQTARKDEVVEIKTLLTHAMESGQRRDASGQLVPRKIINSFVCRYNGRTVFEAKFEPAIAANPALNFFVRCTESGKLDFAWTDDDGSLYTTTQAITVT
ncbi:thiosulfate oxidation carrier complex protein SoxZ [Ferrovibrio sp.]|uniref:thiosulfate oxidation carrier complex protein SoxZ n=1 Tax=Ferrovibrio sp. TaxID=1917215 RepID=UPI003D0C0BDD